MPPKRILDQASTGNASQVASGRSSGQGAGPAEPYSSDQQDVDPAPFAAQPNKLQGRGLGSINRHLRAAFLEVWCLADSPEVAVPGVQVMLEDLLGGLGGQITEPFPAGWWIDASLTELSVDLRGGRAPGDATTATGVPLV